MEIKKIDLMLLPFWTPFIPPLGISILKSFLNRYGQFDITTHDLNAVPEFTQTHNDYMHLIKMNLPKEYQGNINTIGNNLLMYHSLAYLRKESADNYFDLIRELVFKLFNYECDDQMLHVLDNEMANFFDSLSVYIDNLFSKSVPDVLGLSLFNSNIAPSLYVARKLKALNPQCKVIFGGGIFADQLFPGGPNFKSLIGEMSRYIDHVVVGEGEILFLKLLNGELKEGQFIYDSNKDLTGKLDFSELRTPDFDDLDIDRYPYLSTFISRSCPFQCHFCSETIQWGQYRKRNIGEAVSEMTELSMKYNRSLFLLGDSLLDPVITNLSNEIIQAGVKLYWDGYLRVSKNASQPANALLWRSAGFYRARLGVESGSDRVLKLMNKGINKAEIKKTLKNLAAAGIKTTTYWIAGFPGETAEDFAETLDLLVELHEYIFSAECHPFAYFLKGQVASDVWATEQGIEPIFSDVLSKHTMLQSWRVKGSVSRQEVQKRVFDFNVICEQYGIQNPYNYAEWHIADKRWKKLHKHSVPSLLELQKEYKNPHKANTRLSDVANFNKIEDNFNF
jgi:radical SAM superfamily enzyme YgiQ (UPF0313 family)